MINVDATALASEWLETLKARSNDCFFPLFFDEHRYLVLKGGGGSGKSIFAGMKILERCTCEPGHRVLVCRKVAKTIRESCFKQLVGQLAEYYPHSGYKANRGDMYISFPNGNEILFAGLDDVEKLKSIYNITDIWIEEASELLESDFNQLDIRLRGESKWYKQIILSFNPISITHWLKARFFDKKDERATTSETTYKDNRFLDDEARRVLEAFKDTDEYYYSVYCLGEWGVTGKTVFDGRKVTARLRENPLPQKIGRFEYDYDEIKITNISFEADINGDLRIYHPPVSGKPYVIGADTAGDGSDSFVAQVLDNTTGEQVATLRQTTDEDQFAKQLYCLGMYYNIALVGVETNFSTYPVMELERLRYPKQYVRESIDDFTHKTKQSFGFCTSPKTRPVIIANLIKIVRDDVQLIWDKATLEEMLTFVRNEQYRPEAEEGAHDDCIMSLAIAHYIRPQQSYLADEQAMKKTVWTESMWEDYRRASPAEREYLLKKWGEPKR